MLLQKKASTDKEISRYTLNTRKYPTRNRLVFLPTFLNSSYPKIIVWNLKNYFKHLNGSKNYEL